MREGRKEGVAAMLNGQLWKEKWKYKRINSRIMWIKKRVEYEKWVIPSVYDLQKRGV